MTETIVVKRADGSIILTETIGEPDVSSYARYSDKGRRGRPGIKGTEKALNAEVQTILANREVANRFVVAAGVIEARVREAYKIG